MPRPRRSRNALFVLALAALLAACSEDSTGPQIETPATNQRITQHAGVEFTISTAKPGYAVDEPILVSFRVKNTSGAPVSYRFNSTRQHDIRVEENDATFWNWSNGRSFGRAFTSLELGRGESAEWTETWDQLSNGDEAARPGSYEIVGVLPTTGGALESASLRVSIGN